MGETLGIQPNALQASVPFGRSGKAVSRCRVVRELPSDSNRKPIRSDGVRSVRHVHGRNSDSGRRLDPEPKTTGSTIKNATLTRVLGCLAVAGCGTSAGFLRDATTVNQHQYRQEVGAVRFMRTAAGSASTGALLCVIPVSGGQAPYKEAMDVLHKNASLNTNEVLENLREDHTITSYLGFYCTFVLTISADVIELIPPGTANAASDSRALPTQPQKELSDLRKPAPTSPVCELAYQQLGPFIRPFRSLYPNVTFLEPPPPRATFVTACAQQPEDVQRCLQAAYLTANTDGCKDAFSQLASKDRQRLFSVFLSDYE
jgi:hypothetical protein